MNPKAVAKLQAHNEAIAQSVTKAERLARDLVPEAMTPEGIVLLAIKHGIHLAVLHSALRGGKQKS